jgi:DNA repair protein SbcD/Mre11
MHFADTHFGVELYGRLDPETGLNTRLQDFRQSLTSAIDQALEAGVHLAVFAGDAYKTRDPRQTEQREFAACIRRLTDKGVPVVLLTGNHDMPAVRGRAHAVEIYRTLGVSDVHVLSRPELVVLNTPGGPVRIAPMPYLIKGYSVARDEFQGKTLDQTREMLENLYVDYIGAMADQVRAAADDIPTILLGHFWASGAALSSWQKGYFDVNEPQVPLSTLTDTAFDYVALGHIHKHQNLNRHGSPPVVYAGSPDRIDFGEKEEPKGFVLVELRKGGAEYQHVEVKGGRALLDIDVNAEDDTPTETILSAIRRHSLRDAVVKLTYHITEGQQAQVREKEIREALAPAFMVVSIHRKIRRDAAIRSRMLTESRTPREALQLYIDSQDALKPRKELLLSAADLLFRELHEEAI